jgi:hypothetical protein
MSSARRASIGSTSGINEGLDFIRHRSRGGGNNWASPIAAIALAGLYLGLGVVPNILAERPANIVGFLELAFLVPPDISFVATGIDQFAFGHDPLHGFERKTPEESVGSPAARKPLSLGTGRG